MPKESTPAEELEMTEFDSTTGSESSETPGRPMPSGSSPLGRSEPRLSSLPEERGPSLTSPDEGSELPLSSPGSEEMRAGSLSRLIKALGPEAVTSLLVASIDLVKKDRRMSEEEKEEALSELQEMLALLTNSDEMPSPSSEEEDSAPPSMGPSAPMEALPMSSSSTTSPGLPLS